MIRAMLLLFAAAFLAKAVLSLASGKIEIGWVFEPAIVERAKDPFVYWLMVLATSLGGLFIAGAVCCDILFPIN